MEDVCGMGQIGDTLAFLRLESGSISELVVEGACPVADSASRELIGVPLPDALERLDTLFSGGCMVAVGEALRAAAADCYIRQGLPVPDAAVSTAGDESAGGCAACAVRS